MLVSERLRAKISDFGSIRACLRRQKVGESTGVRDTSVDDLFSKDEMEYSEHNATQTKQLHLTAGVGTPLYMAPELFVGTTYGLKADVFSFGVVLWEIATQGEPDLIKQEVGQYRGPLLIKMCNLLQDGKRLNLPQGIDAGRGEMRERERGREREREKERGRV